MGETKKNTALVTGGAGFIGSHTVEELLSSGWRVRVLDDFSSGSRDNLPVKDDRLEVLEADVRDYRAVEDAMSGVAACLHLAAQVSVIRSIEAPHLSAQHNIMGCVNVLQAARQQQVKRIVYASSVAVFGDADRLPLHESTPPDPIAPYGLEKRVDEDYAALFQKLFGLRPLGLRYFNVYGPRQDPANPYAGVITKFASDLRRGAPLTVYGDGAQSRDFIFVKDVARANALALASDKEGALNVGTGQSASLLELIALLAKIIGQDPPIDFEPARPGDIRHSFGDNARLVEALDFTPRWPLEAGLRALLSQTA